MKKTGYEVSMMRLNYLTKEAELLRKNITEFYDNELMVSGIDDSADEYDMIDFVMGFNFLDAYEKNGKVYIVTYNSCGVEDYTIEVTSGGACLVDDGVRVATGIESEICYELFEASKVLANC